MKSNKYIRRLIRSYSESEKKYSIIEILKDLENNGKNSRWGYFISKEAAERLREMGLAPYDRKNEEKLYEAILDIFYEKTDLVDILERLNLNTSNVDDKILEEAKNITKQNWGLIRKILERRGDSKISSLITEDTTRELSQHRRTYSFTSSKFIKNLGFALALIGGMGKLKGAAPEKNPDATAEPKHRMEFVVRDVLDENKKQILLEHFKNKVDTLKLEEGFATFYKSLGLSSVPTGDRLLMKLYKDAVFYTEHIGAFTSKFGDQKSMNLTLSAPDKSDKNDVYIRTVRDLFIASVAGGALETAWELMNHQEFTNNEINTIRLALSTHTYDVEFRDVQYNEATKDFSSVIVIKIPLGNNQLAELTLKIESISTFNFENIESGYKNITRRLQDKFVTARLEDRIRDDYAFYMILPNGINPNTNTIHYLGIIINVNIKAHKVSKQVTSDSSSSSVGMAKLKNKHSKMFGKRKKYVWM